MKTDKPKFLDLVYKDQMRKTMTDVPNKVDYYSTQYKLIKKSESYSVKGFGNGFVSKGDRFTGVNNNQFY